MLVRTLRAASILSLVLTALLLVAPPVAQAAGMEGRSAPAVSLPGPDGKPRTLADLAGGKPTVVLFWASWCPYCKAVMPHLQSMLDQYGNDRIEVVAIDLWEDAADDWKPVIQDNGYDFQVLLNGDALAPQWQVRGTPGLFLLDGDGNVVFDRNARQFAPSRRHVAAIDASQGNGAKAARIAPLWAAELRKEIAAQLAKK
jgi:thiol-disulfide isomerase/thioredoxin